MPERSLQFQIVVVGGGPAGLAAACVAAEAGRQVALVDDTPWLGGQIWRGEQTRFSNPVARRWFIRFRQSGAVLLDQTTVVAAPEPGLLLAELEGKPLQIQWHRLILATGARELFLPFPGWTLPGNFGPGGLQALVKAGWTVRDRRVIIAGSGPLLLAVADGMKKHGARVVAVAEQAPWSRLRAFGLGLWRRPAKAWQAIQLKLRLWRVPYLCGAWPIRAEGDGRVQRVALTDGRRTWNEDCDLFACGFGLVPNIELALALGCELTDLGFVRVDCSQATSISNVYCAGEPNGIGGADCALVEGRIAGHAAAGQPQSAALLRERASWHRFRANLAEAFILRPELSSLAADDTLVCRCEDVSLGEIKKYQTWREAKLHSRCGMGGCQGRVCGAAMKTILGWGMESVRPPILPARVQSLVSGR